MVDKRIVRILAAAALIAAGLLGPSGAAGAAPATADSRQAARPLAEADDGDAALALRPAEAVRARADVQIRRVRSLMLKKPGSVDDAIAALEKLRQALAGRR
jgi:hypothetical protein